MQSWKQRVLSPYHNGFAAIYALGHMIYCYTLLVPVNQKVLNKLSKERNLQISAGKLFATSSHIVISFTIILEYIC